MRIAIFGTRGVPASYGGFETLAEELGVRLALKGHDVTVYCRSHYTPSDMTEYRGMRLVALPSIRHKYLDTIVHTFLSVLHALTQRYDVALFCNAVNAIFIPFVRMVGTPVAMNVDGLEWRRKKWGVVGKAAHLLSERLAGWFATSLVTDARAIQGYYWDTYRKRSTYIAYGARTIRAGGASTLERWNLQRGKYFLYVSRFEPENHAQQVVEAFTRIDRDFRLVMVGTAPYASDYIKQLEELADDRVIFPGAVYGEGYVELMSHAYCYIHATEVGGTHPALLDAIGLGHGLLVADTVENREVAGEDQWFFSLGDGESDLAEKVERALREPREMSRVAEKTRKRVRATYTWESVADDYERLFQSLVQARPTGLEAIQLRRFATDEAVPFATKEGSHDG